MSETQRIWNQYLGRKAAEEQMEAGRAERQAKDREKGESLMLHCIEPAIKEIEGELPAELSPEVLTSKNDLGATVELCLCFAGQRSIIEFRIQSGRTLEVSATVTDARGDAKRSREQLPFEAVCEAEVKRLFYRFFERMLKYR